MLLMDVLATFMGWLADLVPRFEYETRFRVSLLDCRSVILRQAANFLLGMKRRLNRAYSAIQCWLDL